MGGSRQIPELEGVCVGMQNVPKLVWMVQVQGSGVDKTCGRAKKRGMRAGGGLGVGKATDSRTEARRKRDDNEENARAE